MKAIFKRSYNTKEYELLGINLSGCSYFFDIFWNSHYRKTEILITHYCHQKGYEHINKKIIADDIILWKYLNNDNDHDDSSFNAVWIGVFLTKQQDQELSKKFNQILDLKSPFVFICKAKNKPYQVQAAYALSQNDFEIINRYKSYENFCTGIVACLLLYGLFLAWKNRNNPDSEYD